jgi:hypothetical protein
MIEIKTFMLTRSREATHNIIRLYNYKIRCISNWQQRAAEDFRYKATPAYLPIDSVTVIIQCCVFAEYEWQKKEKCCSHLPLLHQLEEIFVFFAVAFSLCVQYIFMCVCVCV